LPDISAKALCGFSSGMVNPVFSAFCCACNQEPEVAAKITVNSSGIIFFILMFLFFGMI
jgi:hypothetical protein